MAHFRVFRGTEVFLQNSGLFFQYLLHFYLTMYALDLTCAHQSMTQKCLSYLMCAAISFFSEENAKRNRCGGL